MGLVRRAQGKHEWRHALPQAGADDAFELGCGECRIARQAALRGVPDHDAVLVGLRQLEAMALEHRARAVQRAAGGNGVGDLAPRQQFERVAGISRDRRIFIEQGAVEVEYDQFHLKQVVCNWCQAV